MRVIAAQRNPWGAAAFEGGLEAQRTDLWVADFENVRSGVNSVFQATGQDPLPPIFSFYAQSVSLPSLELKADQVRRDSRPYNMPAWDEPLGATRITFLVDAKDTENSTIYQLLDRWRMIVRAGRGSLGTEPSFTLNANYRIDYAFPVGLWLLRGASIPELVTAEPPVFFPFDSNVTADSPPMSRWRVENDLEFSGQYVLEKAWLSNFKLGDLSYTGASQVMTLEANLFAENLVDLRSKFTF